MVIPPIMDVDAFPGPYSQARLEDLQLSSFLAAVAVGGGRHPFEISVPVSDPPDRIVRAADDTWGLELTELTIEDLRTGLGPMRAFGRELRERLDQSDDYKHLRGRVVSVTPIGTDAPKKPIQDMADVLSALKADKGSVTDVKEDLTLGAADHIPNDLGDYGSIGSLHVDVNGPGAVPGEIRVSASAHAQLRLSELLAGFEARTTEKDLPGNDLLLITCGLPDKRGYLCQADEWIFQILRDAFSEGLLLTRKPAHISAIAVHSFGRYQWFEAYRNADASPPLWRS
jgi:hypothetical protein